ncbi:MAG: HAD family hydrolase [Atopobiaceae bacterium]|nr:HAD family hydrolase [Atopobiaceae bacterium]
MALPSIVFDMDDTLYDLMESFARTHRALFAGRTDADPETIYIASRKYSDLVADLLAQGRISTEQEFPYRFRRAYADFGVSLSLEDLQGFERLYRAFQKEIRIPEGIVAMLEGLGRRGVLYAVLSNGRHSSQWAKIEALGLTRYIPRDRIFISQDLPAAKPDPRAFRAVEDALGLDPGNSWYVGDNFPSDIVGAFAAGWHSIWFNHRGHPFPEGTTVDGRAVIPDFEVHTVEELSALLDSIIDSAA